MITWNDFILDDFFGPVLKSNDGVLSVDSDALRLRRKTEDALESLLGFTEETRKASNHQEDAGSALKNSQETEPLQRLARMAGHDSSDVDAHMDVGSKRLRVKNSVKEGGSGCQ